MKDPAPGKVAPDIPSQMAWQEVRSSEDLIIVAAIDWCFVGIAYPGVERNAPGDIDAAKLESPAMQDVGDASSRYHFGRNGPIRKIEVGLLSG